jgi:alpha-ketoglutarate-dependent taurine dioxygenase
MAIAVHPTTPRLGAEIGGVDLREPLSATTIADIRAAWLLYGVIFFRDQQLDHDQHRDFGRQFGDL